MLILDMYITTLPVILSGILNMVFTRTKFYKEHKTPIDGYKTLKDNKRIFGDNKTWIGFFSMIILCIVTQIIFGFILNVFNLNSHNELYNLRTNTFLYNLFVGFLYGFIYMIFELPNSFIKRRINIPPGKTLKTPLGILFFIIDQIDSLIGVMFIIYLLSDISFIKYLGYIALGAITHVTINLILYRVKIRRNV